MFILKLFTLVGVVVTFVLCDEDTSSSLELVHVFFRHGDRTPDAKDIFPTDPYNEASFYPIGYGQLTNNGKMKSYSLGSMLRNRYNNFLGKIYTSDIIKASCTDSDRTKMSLLLVLAGLWPPSLQVQQWNSNLMWQPIPINYRPEKYDFVIQRPRYYCPKYVEELHKVTNSPDVQNFALQNRNLFEYVEQWTGKKISQVIDMFDVYQTLNAEISMNLTLPEWTYKIYPEPIHSIAGMQLSFENYNDVLNKLNGGRQLQMIINAANAKITENLVPKGRKMYLISGHENNLVNVLSALNLFTPHVPQYGSAVIFELRKDINTGQYGYKVYYHNSTSSDPTLLTIPGCNEFCQFDKFINLTSKIVPKNYTEECESPINLEQQDYY